MLLHFDKIWLISTLVLISQPIGNFPVYWVKYVFNVSELCHYRF